MRHAGADRPVPVFTPAVMAVSLLAFLLPGVSAVLVYDRQAVFGGEAWRLLTSHAVHFSFSHLGYNLLVFGIAGWLVERRSRANLILLYMLSSVLIGVYLLAFLPAMGFYGGLSGIAVASVIYASLEGIRLRGRLGWLYAGILILTALKLAFELRAGTAIFVSFGDVRIGHVPGAHVLGALAAAGLYLWRSVFAGYQGSGQAAGAASVNQ